MDLNHLQFLVDSESEIFSLIDQSKEELIQLTISIATIAAPTFGESKRAEFVKNQFEKYGYTTQIDKVGNVLASKDFDFQKQFVVSAHLDTVFPDSTIEIRREGDILYGPGVGDDSRGIANLLFLAKLLFTKNIVNNFLFVATVGEEGRGDLRGVKHLFSKKNILGLNPDAFISIDGTGTSNVVDQGIGSLRYRVHFRGPGGHSFGSFGTVNPVYSLATFVENYSKIELRDYAQSSYNIGVIGGGTSINAIPEHVWVDIDFRSSHPDELNRLNQLIKKLANEAITEENNKRSGEILSEFEVVGKRPAGKLSEDSWLRDVIKLSHDYLKIDCNFIASSTDSNVPLSKGIPALSLASVESAGRAHSYDEWIDASQSSLITIKRNFLVILLMAD